MDLLEIGLGGVDWIGLAQNRYRWRALVNAIMNLRVPQNAGKLLGGCTTCGLTGGARLLDSETILIRDIGHHEIR
jgi:hypothetical protein